MTSTHLSLLFVLLMACVVMTTPKLSPRNTRNQLLLQDAAVEDSVGEDVCEVEVTCKGGKSLPVSLPIKAPRGPAGKPGTPGLPGKQGLPGVSSVEDSQAKVAFFVGLRLNVGPVSRNTDLPFDKVITNIGGAFIPETGRFTSPINGTFVFSLTISAQGRQRAAVELVLNNKMVVTTWAESIPYWASASSTAILNLGVGDQVWLMLLSRAPYLHGYMYTTFSGFCLYQGL